MNRKLLILPVIALVVACGEEEPVVEETITYSYPDTKRSDHVDNYHGTDVADPYQWLEFDTAPDVEAWVKEQNKVTYAHLETMEQREQIRARLTEIWNYSKKTAPFKKGEWWYYFLNDGIQNHAVMYRTAHADSTGEIFLDPNTFSEGGTTALTGYSWSKDHQYLAYSVGHSGSDWREFFVLNLETGEKLDDHVKWGKFTGISWLGNGFFYSRYDAPVEGMEYSNKNEFHKVYYHNVGTSQEDDILVYADMDHALRNFYVSVTDDEAWIVLGGSEGTSGNSVHIMKAPARIDANTVFNFQPVVSDFEKDYWVMDHIDGNLYVETNDGAPNRRVVKFDPNNPAKANWTDVIPEREHVLDAISLAKGKIIARYLEDVVSHVYVHNLDGSLDHEMELPGIGKVNSLSFDRERATGYYSFVTFTGPTTVYSYNVESKERSEWFRPDIDFDTESLVTQQVFYKSKDGETIPMFITHKKDLEYDGNTPTMLYGYGGFDISITPEFRLDRSVFLESGGIYAVANLRGGGEYGEAWHKAGTKLQKQNVFDDFIAAAEYLCSEGYTNKDKLAIHGRSNGGLLVGAVMTQRPDLCKVALPKVGVLDMLKFHKFTIGWAWTGDYGSSENPEEFEYLLGYSPVHNVDSAAYPATLVITGDHDDRVVPAHSFKFISELQRNQAGKLPVMIRIDTDGGHGSGKPVSMQIAEFTDQWAFVFHHLGMEVR